MKKFLKKNAREIGLLLTTVIFSGLWVWLATVFPKILVCYFVFVAQLAIQLVLGIIFTPKSYKCNWDKYVVCWWVSVIIAGVACGYYMNHLVAMNNSRWFALVVFYVILLLFGWLVMNAIYVTKRRNYENKESDA